VSREIGPVGTSVRVVLGLLFLGTAAYGAAQVPANLLWLPGAGFLGLLGVSLLLAVRQGLSDCELAAIPNQLTGRRRHLFCVGGLSHLDRWERARKPKSGPAEPPGGGSG
jgi:hypothetical protein